MEKTIDGKMKVSLRDVLIVAVVLVPFVGWCYAMNVKMDYTQKAVEPIPKMQQDIAAMRETLSDWQQAGATGPVAQAK